MSSYLSPLQLNLTRKGLKSQKKSIKFCEIPLAEEILSTITAESFGNFELKAAVKHFYETLQSKALRVEKWKTPNYTNLHKEKYVSRQKLLEGLDPFSKCIRIEASMRSKTYNVVDKSGISHEDSSCKCYRCYLDAESGKIAPHLSKFDENGNSDSCSLYFTDVEETCNNFM